MSDDRELPEWLPRSILTFASGYSAHDLTADLIAGVTVGLVALPLAMAFAISSGLTPQAGIYTAVVAGIVARYGVDGLFMCTMMAGAILVGLGVTGMGSAIRFIPRPVVVGFTNGIAVLIA